MKKICLVLVYFGQLPSYFQLWLDSAKKNSTIDFLLVTDNTLTDFSVPSNVTVRNMEFSEFQDLVYEKVDVNCSIDTPYKICDYKPTYGLLFNNYLNEYDFWGWVDPDMIFGDLRSFLNEEVLEEYDKIGEAGMFVMLRNNDKFNTYFRNDQLKTVGVNWREAFFSRYSRLFDESDFMNRTWDEVLGRRSSLHGVVGDTRPQTFDFKTHMASDVGKELYRYTNGKLYRIGENEFSEEMMWVHFLKRDMNYKNLVDSNDYWILPNGFLSSDDDRFYENYSPTKQEVSEYNKRFKKIVIRKWRGRVRDGWLYYYIRRKFRMFRGIKAN